MDSPKKAIKLFTYVDAGLNDEIQGCMRDFKIPNRAKLIRRAIRTYILCLKALNKSDIEFDLKDKSCLVTFFENIGEKYWRPPEALHDKIKQKLSPLKTALLVADSIRCNMDMKDSIATHAGEALKDLEEFLISLFKKPDPKRHVRQFDVLHVDDEPLERKILTTYFQKRGLEVVSVEKASEALEVLKEKTPRAILIDLVLKTSEMNGDRLSMILKSREEYQNIPIVLTSGMISEEECEILKHRSGAGADQDRMRRDVPKKDFAAIISRLARGFRVSYKNRNGS